MRKLIIEHNGKEYTGQIMNIRSTNLYYEDHGIFTASLNCEYPGGGISVGGYALDRYVGRDDDYGREGTAYGLDHIMKILWVVGVNGWEKLPGNDVIVLSADGGGPGSTAAGLANVLDESRVFIPSEHAGAWRARGDSA